MRTDLDRSRGKLILADGTRFDGYLIGSGLLPVSGEVVFNTSMMGYQEVITDPSYAGQIVVMTYPHIGNYGVSPGDSEGTSIAARALVVRELSPFFSPGPGRSCLESFMKEQGLTGLTGVDTRALTLQIRSEGVAIGVIGTIDQPDEVLLRVARGKAYSKNEALVYSVTSKRSAAPARTEQTVAKPPEDRAGAPPGNHIVPRQAKSTARAALIDLGIKRSITAHIKALGIETTVLDAHFGVREILSGGFDFLVLSNGPGDPTDVPDVIRKVEKLLGNIPILGICLGHQIVALAMGGETFKMKFGHRGANQPVLCRRTGRVHITSQNHGYAVSTSLEHHADAEITYVNLNDGTIEGFADPGRNIECVQFHPEASPGPRDTVFIFNAFSRKVLGPRHASIA